MNPFLRLWNFILLALFISDCSPLAFPRKSDCSVFEGKWYNTGISENAYDFYVDVLSIFGLEMNCDILQFAETEHERTNGIERLTVQKIGTEITSNFTLDGTYVQKTEPDHHGVFEMMYVNGEDKKNDYTFIILIGC